MGIYHDRKLLRWLQESDPYDYYENGVLNIEAVPQELQEPLQHLVDRVEEYHLQLFSQKQLEYHALQSRINPHFLYNTLEAVRAQALEIGAQDIEGMVNCISRFFRYSISARKDFVLIREELANIDDYFRIQQYRFRDRFSLKLIIEDEGALDSYLPKMLLQPIVENAVFHGLEPKKGLGTVTVRIMHIDDDIHISVSDDGIGIPAEQLEQLNHTLNYGRHTMEKAEDPKRRRGSLHNVNARIHLYCGKNHGVFVHSSQGIGTDVDLILPYAPLEKLHEYSIEDSYAT